MAVCSYCWESFQTDPTRRWAREIVNSIWIFSGKNVYITGSLIAGCVATLAVYVLVSIQISKDSLVSSWGSFGNEVIAGFSIGAGGQIFIAYDPCFLHWNLSWLSVDLLIALLLSYYLRRGKSGFDKFVPSLHIFVQPNIHQSGRTNTLVSRIIQYTIATGLATRFVYLFLDYLFCSCGPSLLAIVCLIAVGLLSSLDH